jgi:hypothetical protein
LRLPGRWAGVVDVVPARLAVAEPAPVFVLFAGSGLA